MKEEFDFNNVGKRMPYQVPAGFFDRVTERTLAAAENREGSNKQPKPVRWRALSVAASLAALLLLVGYFLFTGNSGNPQQTQIIADAAPPQAATADSGVLPAPAVAIQEQPQPVPEIKSAKAPATPAHQQKQQPEKPQPAQPSEPETLEEVLAGITDEELRQLTAIARAEEYIIDQTIN